MAVALSCQKLRHWIEAAIEKFGGQDLLGVPEPWLRIYEMLADYIGQETPIDQKLIWMIEGADDSLPDIVYQLQRLKNALVVEIVADGTPDDLQPVLTWFDQTIVTLIERASGDFAQERGLSMPYETVFWKSRDGMYISTIEGKFIHCNQALLDMLGYEDMDSLSELNIADELYVDSDQRQVMIDHLMRDSFFDHHEFQFRDREGAVKTALESCYLVDLPKHRYIVGIMVDVTQDREVEAKREAYMRRVERERMEAHFSLRQIAKRFDALLKVNDHPVVMIDPKNFRFIHCNPSFLKRFKYQRRHLETVTFRDLFDRADWMEIFSQISGLTQRMQYHIPNVDCITYDHESFPAKLSVVVHQDDKGSALFVQIEDFSEEAKLEARLSQVEKNHRRLLEGAPLGVIAFREDGQIAFVNRYIAERLGYRPYQLRNPVFINQLFPREEYRLKFNKYIRRFLRGEHAENVTVELKAKSGEARAFLLNTLNYQLEDEAKPGFLAMLVDVTRGEGEVIKRLDVETDAQLEAQLFKLQEAYEELRGRAILRQDFLKLLAKKFKEPIHVVLGFASLLKKDLHDLIDTDQREDLDIIEKHIRYVLSMLEKAVEYAQLGDDEIHYMPEETYVRAMLDDLFVRLKPQKLAKGVTFKGEHQILSVDLKVECDVQILESMLRHIVDNAVTFTESGLIELTAYQQDRSLWFEVRDEGCGLESDELEQVTDPFFQAREQDAGPERGIGLGLSIAKKYAELMGATLQFDAQPNVGARVTVRLDGLLTD